MLHVEFDALLVADHSAGQEIDAFTESGGDTDAELLGFNLDPEQGSTTITQIVFSLSAISGLVDGDWAGIEIVVDDNNDGDIGGGETTTVGGAGVVSTSGGTITFSTSFVVSATTDYILRADFASLLDGDNVSIVMAPAWRCHPVAASQQVPAAGGLLAHAIAAALVNPRFSPPARGVPAAHVTA